MVKRILIAFDGSTGAEAAVKDLLYAGLPERAEAKILTLADVWMPPAPSPGESVQAGYLHSAAHEDAAEAVREARNTAVYGARFVHGIFPDWTICNVAKADSPAWAIMDEAKRWGADLVVIGSHG